MAKILAIILIAIALASCVEGEGRFVKGIRQKLGMRARPRSNYYHQAGHQTGGGSSAAAASAASASQPEPEVQYYPAQPYYQPGVAPQYYGSYQPSPVYKSPYEQQHVGSGGSSAASSAAAAASGGSAAASAAAAAAAAAKPKKFYVAPPPSHYGSQYSHPHYGYETKPLNIESEIAAATSAAAASSTSGHVGTLGHQPGAHIPAEYGTREVYRETPVHFSSGPQENVHFASSGIYDGDDNGLNENSYYRKSAEEERNHEDGSEESGHYLSTKSHGKSGQENLRIRQGRDDFDQEIGPYSIKTKKRNNFNFVDWNKAKSETGTSVLQKDHHKSAYNRDTIKSREEIDAATNKYSNGRVETSGLKSRSYVDDEDSELYDSHGVYGQYRAPASAAGSASAAASAGNTASSSSSSAAGH